MGLILRMLEGLFGGGAGEMRRTVEVFRENAESGAQRGQVMQQAALQQFAAEFARDRRGLFDRLIDGLNRLPRPGLALGTLALFVAAMVDPQWFAARMQGIALVPEPLWWLLGVIVSFYFGARHQAKGQAFQLRLGQTLAQLPQIAAQLPPAPVAEERATPTDNPALAAWQQARQDQG
ncbi:hypothetical protein TL5118_01381 [Thalassovita autumnalis]|uniref:Holin of 3TMs, for gene-transfer release n=1 Tax=Thalassovita autumnalis TaxID=2072972 RepID=A0A0P1G644_9RHOB|nr:holin family protein [Thalassovita autumnalis]CUH65597.1 hypothetical protein TL5118_01381 [Thalassovita autumnalis]CUH70585.1 hypothetical protein TL5120_00362 [Thalassovita autumnalis]